MAYNKAREEYRWKKWKDEEEQKLRELGMDEESIQALRESDWANFKEDRRYHEHQVSILDYLEILLDETDAAVPQIQSVEELLDSIDNEQILHTLLNTDRTTLQILVLKMLGYATKEIASYLNMPEQTVYSRIRRLKKKMKKYLKQ
ncbi:MAG: sigma-70 family RNA polymerase sigma factor [Lachnospiraceae bacterium]|nr:sigma-70 family RNA polymerase sigma factor [Lachnospiraceae bacterium]